jgi:hypothetical protein
MGNRIHRHLLPQRSREMNAPFTLQMLIDAKACEEQTVLFSETFGDSVNVTVARAKKVAKLFDWHFARRFLDEQGKADYDRARAAAWADYNRICDAAFADYNRICDAAWADYGRIRPAAWADYNRICNAALADYDRARAAAWADLNRAIAAAWATAYIATCRRKGAVK